MPTPTKDVQFQRYYIWKGHTELVVGGRERHVAEFELLEIFSTLNTDFYLKKKRPFDSLKYKHSAPNSLNFVESIYTSYQS